MENPCRCATHKLYYIFFLDFEMSIRYRALRIENSLVTRQKARFNI